MIEGAELAREGKFGVREWYWEYEKEDGNWDGRGEYRGGKTPQFYFAPNP